LEAGTLIANSYLAALGILAVYGFHRLTHLARFRWREGTASPEPVADETLPHVTVQLPVYNERTVVARLIRAAGALDWPADRLEVQVLDDSSDETTEIADREVARLVGRGIDARVVRRPDRRGFKAGALENGLARAKGELVCVFDADFVPPADFLRRTIGAFDDPRVGMVQARWEHLNRDESALTRAQSTLLDGHFVIEHKVRADGGLFFNFNGTAGIWRREAIESAGGWEHDTLTEDLDLSYRAQLAGWRFVYVPLIVAPAEVPPDIAAFKSQQHRWAKGSVQVLRKLAWRILASREPLRVKLEALAHLSGNVGYPIVLLLALLLPLSISEQERFGGWAHLILFCLCTLSVILFYDRGQKAIGRSGFQRLRDVPAAMSLGIGMCVSQTRAVIEGLFGDSGAFVRTPKRGDSGAVRSYRAVLRGLPGVELLLATWFAWALVQATRLGHWGVLPFLLLFFTGFAWVGLLSVREWSRG
jgi:cellulose synthase/poly-beta-1,6-N-acetylglucosamine synthase-like glycosyltransferase